MENTLRISFVGWGAIARRAAELLGQRNDGRIRIVAAAVRDTARPRDGLAEDARLISGPGDLADIDTDIVVEAAGRDAVAGWGAAALSLGHDFIVCSTSAFCDADVPSRLRAAAAPSGARIIVPPGALGGMDALAAAAMLPLESVEHTIIKPPAAWKGTGAEDLVDLDALEEARDFFEGDARSAADRFPQNANVAVISALAGIGLDRTLVTLRADPGAAMNAHRVRAIGDFGRMDMFVENRPLATNPKSSEMTALNLVRVIERRVAPLVL